MNNENIADVTTADSSSFKYKSCLLEKPPSATGALENAKTVVLIISIQLF